MIDEQPILESWNEISVYLKRLGPGHEHNGLDARPAPE
jgi:hypothetical protein